LSGRFWALRGTRNTHRTPLASIKILGKSGMAEIVYWFNEFMRN
jgi:hypothetical protein